MVSVIIAAFNVSEYLEQCLESLLIQTFRDIEIIVVNDGSTDSTLNILNLFALKDNRIRVFSQENQGVSAARNFGMTKALGEFMTFVDADDWMNLRYIEQLVHGISEEDSDCCICGYSLDFPDGTLQNIKLQTHILSGEQALEDMLRPDKFQGFLWNKLFKTRIICENHLKMDESLYYMEDLDFCAKYFTHCGSIKCISYIGYNYRQHVESITCGWKNLKENMISKRETAVTALNEVMKCCATNNAKHLCKTKIQTEYAEMLIGVSATGKNSKEFKRYKREIRRGLLTVISSSLPLKQKIRQVGMFFFPKSVSRYLNKRQSDRFRWR